MHLPLLLLEELNFLERERTRSFFSGNPSLFRESLEESKTLNRVRAAHRYRARGAPVCCTRGTSGGCARRTGCEVFASCFIYD
jgi:hypothetical protein